jgi:preprotein translocase subunit SecF
MEIIIAIVVIAIGAIWYFNRDKGLDVNADGKVNVDDVKAAVENAVVAVKEVVDVNKDGTVDAKDVKAVATKAKATVRKTATKATTKAKETVKKTATKATGAKRGPKPKTSV